MSAHPRGIPVLFVLLLALGTAPAQEEGESIREIQVKEILAACKDAPADRIWAHSEQLVKLGPAARRLIQRNLAGSSVEGRLAGLRALIELGNPAIAAERLMTIAGDEKAAVQHRVLALELVGETEEPDAEEELVVVLQDYNPEIRIAAARALWRIEGEHATKAKDALRDMLRSEDPELQAQGALALAETGDIETPGVREKLMELRKQPGERGRLANALYQKLQLKKVISFYERKADEATATSRRNSPWRHLDEIYQMLQSYYDDPNNEVDLESLRAAAARGMLQFPSDPHTIFLGPQQYQEFLHGADGVDPSYGGIGAFINTNVKDRFEILRPIFGGPAWNADIRGGDVILAVNGERIAGLSTTEIIKRIKGPPGTPVILTIIREGWAEPKDIKVIRAKIVLPSVTSRMLPGKIGYVSVAQFSYETGKELWQALTALEAQGMRGLVLDVRDNPGGLLGSVKQCLTLFLKEGDLVCTVKGRNYDLEKHVTGRPDRARAYPISVLVNGVSASGAELMSGVMQHYSKRSQRTSAEKPYLDVQVLGEPTFGKGTVQHTRPLKTWPGEKFTDEPRRNGRYDYGEPYTDQNKNRRWDPGEPFKDLPLLNNRWDDGEPWKDTNGNGTRDEGEDFTDQNGDGKWNPPEKFEDLDGNGRYDYGAALKLTVARYYLPGGANFTRQRYWDKENEKYDYKGGVVPDIRVESDRWQIAHLVELRELQQKGVFSDYASKQWKSDKETLRKLAWFDGRDPARYPGFDAFYEGLNTRLTRQEVRQALRIEVRREAANEIGKEILGDLSDDNVLRRGVHEVLQRLGDDPNSIEEYRALENATR